MLPYVLFVIGLVILIKGADFLVDGASGIARRLKVSDLVIGLTVVAFGTSTPELFVNIFASIKGNTEIAVGNVLGSNIFNIFLVLGISAVIYPLEVTKGTVWREIPFSLLAALILCFLANDQLIDHAHSSALTRIDGLVFLSFFMIFLYYSFSTAKSIEGMQEDRPAKEHGVLKSCLLVAAGLAGLGLGGKWIVDGAVHMALRLGMSEAVIGLTIVAAGTSLPELATSAVAAHKKNVEIAVGNVVGSSIFNIFFILGISSMIKTLPFNLKSNVDIGIVILASLLLFLSMFTGKKRSLERWEGTIFIMIYGAYTLFLIVQR